MFRATLNARPFDSEEEAIHAVLTHDIHPGDIALITDGRFSGASTGPSIGHCSPEAAEGAPIALVEEGDLIHIDIPERRLEIVGVKGEPKTPEEMDQILAQRRAAWKPKPSKYPSGVLKIFSEHAVSPMQGGYMK